MPRIRALRAAAAAIVVLGLAFAPGSAGAAVIGFDELAAGTAVDEEYAAQGVRFGPSPFAGTTGPFTASARPQARSAPNVAAFTYDPGTDFSSSWIRFERQQRRVRFFACRAGGGGGPQPNVNVLGYDALGQQVYERQGIVCTQDGPLVEVAVEGSQITYLNVYGTGEGWALDDLEYETDPPPAPAPTPTPPPPPPPPPPTTPPETVITEGPTEGAIVYAPPLGSGATFRFDTDAATGFALDRGGIAFQCRIETLPLPAPQVPFTPCTSPYTVPNLTTGKAYAFEVRAVDGRGRIEPTPVRRTFRYEAFRIGVPTGNFRLRGIDVFQVVQPNAGARQNRFGIRLSQYAGGGTPTDWRVAAPPLRIDSDSQTVPYEGVTLDPDGRTRAVVYVDMERLSASFVPQDLDVTLEMRRDGAGNGKVWTQTKRIIRPPSATTPFVTLLERSQVSMGQQFEIARPRDARPSDSFSLTASVKYTPGTTTLFTRECDDRECASDNTFTLRKINVATGYGDLRMAPLELFRTGQSLRSPVQVLERAREVFPNLLGTSPGPYRDRIDITAATNLVPTPNPATQSFTCNGIAWPVARFPTAAAAQRACRSSAVSNLVDAWSTRNPPRVADGDRLRREYDVVLGIQDYDAEPGWTSSGANVTQVGRTTPGTPAPRFVVDATARPLSAVAHELGHMMGAPHAGQNCPGTAAGQSQAGEPWPSDDQGRLQGTKLDANRPAAPLVDGQNATLYDLMSYCADTSDTATIDGNQWVSSDLWNRVTAQFVALGQRVARGSVLLAARSRAATAAQRRDTAVATGTVTDGGGRIARIVAPDEDSAGPATAPESRLRLRALAAGGAVLAEEGVRSVGSSELGGFETFAGAVPATAAAVELIRDGQVLDRLVRSAPAVVRLLSPGRHARARAGRDLVVRWAQSDPDGGRGPLEASVEFSADGGRRWRTVHQGPSTGRVAVPGRLLARGVRARVRVGVSDGFSETRVTSAPFRSDGAAPVVQILTPQRREDLRADARAGLLGAAFDDAGARLPGRRLTWFAGRRRLGTGERLSVRLPAGASVLRLVGRDASGRTGVARLSVRVARPPLRLADLRHARRVPRSARSLTVRVQTSAPSILSVAGRRYRLGTRLQRIVVTLPRRPATGVLRVPITAVPRGSAAAGRARGIIEVSRR